MPEKLKIPTFAKTSGCIIITTKISLKYFSALIKGIP